MPPQSTSPALHLLVQPQPFFLIQLPATAVLPAALLARVAAPSSESEFLSVTRTREEVSIVSDFRIGGIDVLVTEPATEWRCIRVAGPMNLGLTGIMHDLTAPLKSAKIPIFAISTWDTDFVLVPKEKSDVAAEAMRKDGWVVRMP